MILTGMGPVSTLNTVAAKFFAAAYALFSGVFFLAASSIVLAPLLHLLFHAAEGKQAFKTEAAPSVPEAAS